MKKKSDKKTNKRNAKNQEPKNAGKVGKSKAPKKAPKIKSLKHDDKFELGLGTADKPIIIKGGAATKPKRAKKELRRVAKTGGFTAWDGRTGKTFATKKEADDYAAEVSKQLGEKIEVTKTDRQVTHTFKAESESKK